MNPWLQKAKQNESMAVKGSAERIHGCMRLSGTNPLLQEAQRNEPMAAKG